MIVGKFHGFRTIRGPGEANTKLIVHPDRILPCPVAFQSFQPVAWRRSQIVQRFGRVQIAQLSTGVTLTRSAGNPFRASPWKAASVAASLKDLITLSCALSLDALDVFCIKILPRHFQVVVGL